MGSIPVLKPREVVALLERKGFVEIRQRGSHKQFRHPDGCTTTVPFHAGRDISPALFVTGSNFRVDASFRHLKTHENPADEE